MAGAYQLDVDKTWAETYRDLAHCFDLWGVRHWSAEANVPNTRTNSRSLSQAERAVTVQFEHRDRTAILSLDTQISPAMNLRAIYLCLDAMRLIERRGLAEVAQSAYLQLAPTAPEWSALLGVAPSATRDEIQAAYRLHARTAHPDVGGSDEQMAALNRARDEALAAVPR